MFQCALPFFLFIAVSARAQQLKPLQFREESYNFGNIQEDGGPVLHQFDFTNTGARPVKVLSVKASCGCTTPDWTREPVPPGKTGFIQARFDPKGRPGYFSKSLTVLTDLEANPVVLQIKGQVISGQDGETIGAEYKSESGSWRLKTSIFNLGKVYLKDEFAAKEFPVANAGEKAVTVQKIESPGYIKVEARPETLEPGKTGKLIVSYNGRMKNRYGFQSDHIAIHTDDAAEPVKQFSVYATLEEYFAPLTQKELDNAPRLKLIDTSFDMGNIRQNEETKQIVTLINTGKTDLEIRAIQPNCTCIRVRSSATTVKAGGNATLEIFFNPKDRQGSQQKAVTIYSSDPKDPVQRITFTAYVRK